MLPDDPRHGTPAGRTAHRRAGVPACEPCKVAIRRHDKKRRILGGPKSRVTLGDVAHRIAVETPRSELERAGIGSSMVTRIRRGGPDMTLTREMRDKVLAVGDGHITLRGVVRRLQALAALGWSNRALAHECGVNLTTLQEIRNGQHQHYVHREVAVKVGEAYDRLSMRLLPENRFTTRVRNDARRRGWAAPMAWDDIDTDEQPHRPKATVNKWDDVDPAVVERVLSGEKLTTTRAEKEEVRRRWIKSGRSPYELDGMQGWRSHRYVTREAS